MRVVSRDLIGGFHFNFDKDAWMDMYPDVLDVAAKEGLLSFTKYLTEDRRPSLDALQRYMTLALTHHRFSLIHWYFNLYRSMAEQRTYSNLHDVFDVFYEAALLMGFRDYISSSLFRAMAIIRNAPNNDIAEIVTVTEAVIEGDVEESWEKNWSVRMQNSPYLRVAIAFLLLHRQDRLLSSLVEQDVLQMPADRWLVQHAALTSRYGMSIPFMALLKERKWPEIPTPYTQLKDDDALVGMLEDALVMACRAGWADLVDAMWDNFERRQNLAWSCMHLAVVHHRVDVVKLFVEMSRVELDELSLDIARDFQFIDLAELIQPQVRR